MLLDGEAVGYETWMRPELENVSSVVDAPSVAVGIGTLPVSECKATVRE
jgi:hypothetical protein